MIEVWYQILAGGCQYNISYQQCDCNNWNGTSCCCWATWDNHFPDCLRTFVSSTKLICLDVSCQKFQVARKSPNNSIISATGHVRATAVHCRAKSVQKGLNLIYILCTITWTKEFTSSSSVYFNIILLQLLAYTFSINRESVNQYVPVWQSIWIFQNLKKKPEHRYDIFYVIRSMINSFGFQ